MANDRSYARWVSQQHVRRHNMVQPLLSHSSPILCPGQRSARPTCSRPANDVQCMISTGVTLGSTVPLCTSYSRRVSFAQAKKQDPDRSDSRDSTPALHLSLLTSSLGSHSESLGVFAGAARNRHSLGREMLRDPALVKALHLAGGGRPGEARPKRTCVGPISGRRLTSHNIV